LLKRNSRFISILLVFILLFSWPLAAWATEADNPELLQEVSRLIAKYFIRPVDESILTKTTIKDMVDSLNDPYTAYYTQEEYKSFRDSTEGVFGGVGIRVEQIGDYVVVVAPLKGTPAQKAGLVSGDKVLAVDGENVVGKGLEYVVSKIKGQAGTRVVLTVEREEQPGLLEFTLIRENIQIEVIEYDMLDENLGYIRLNTFSRTAGKEFRKALTDLKAQGMEGLIFDLRDNPGGYLNSALDIAADFADKGETLLYVIGRDGLKDETQSLSDALNIPTVVLVNGGSASASEIVAGAIQDLGKGVLVGTKTFGKASVQTVFELSNGGALKLTTAKYLTPGEQVINGIGLTPDYIVEDIEAQLDKALSILKEQLDITSPQAIVLNINSPVAIVGAKEVALDTKPLLQNGRLLVPGRFLAQALEGQITWDKGTQTVTILSGGRTITLVPDENRGLVDGAELKLEVPARLVAGRIYVPLRLVCETFKAEVYFNQASGQVQILP